MSTPARRRLLRPFPKSKQRRCNQTCCVTESPKKNTRRPGFPRKMCCMHAPDTHRYAAFILLAVASSVGNEEGAVCRTAPPYRRPGGARSQALGAIQPWHTCSHTSGLGAGTSQPLSVGERRTHGGADSLK
eukprot:scaffold994_cov226-Prasinococcus_capsulatus_cf.AAC.25